MNKQISKILANNIKQWGTRNNNKKIQNVTFLNTVKLLLSRIENLEHMTTSLLTGLREQIYTVIRLMEEIKPTEENNKEK